MEVLTVSRFSVSSIFVRYQLSSGVDISHISHVVFFYTHLNVTDDVTAWNNVTLSVTNTTHLTNDSVQLWEFGKSDVLYGLGDTYFFIVPNLTLGVFYYLKLMLDFKPASIKNSGRMYISDTRVSKLGGKLL